MQTNFLFRHTDKQEQGFFGSLVIPSAHWSCCTLELPWRGNEPFKSCIPAGRYAVNQTYSPDREQEAYEVLGVTGRDGIRFDIANIVDDLRGCIGLGMDTGTLYGKPAILHSKTAITRFLELTGGKPFDLMILNCNPCPNPRSDDYFIPTFLRGHA